MSINIDTLVNDNKELLSELEHLINYRFTDLRLLQKALIHSSFAFEQSQVGKDNEILEFLGDAVLDLVIGHILSRRFPGMREGELTRIRASLVNEQHLAEMARSIELGRFLCLGKGENASNGRNKSSILCGAFEALVGAIFEDSGYATSSDLIGRLFSDKIDVKKADLVLADAKSRLQDSCIVILVHHDESWYYSYDTWIRSCV